MANYTIIGGDKKEYGPVTGEEILQWVMEGRLDANSQVRGENDTEWRPLSAFPEFSSPSQVRGPTPPPIGFPSGSVPGAGADQVKAPAIALIVVGGMCVLFALWNLATQLLNPQTPEQMMAIMSSSPQFNDPQVQNLLKEPQFQSVLHAFTNPVIRIGSSVFGLAMSALVLWGAVRMLACRNYEFAVVAAILVMIPCLTPCPCCVLGLPIGIWAIIVLRKPGVKGQFH